MKSLGFIRTAATIASVVLLHAGSASATVTAAFSAGSTCGGATSAAFVPAGAGITVTLCASTTTEQVCNSTLQPIAASAGESGRFQITNRTVPASGLTDPTNAAPAYPVPINNPVNTTDFGSSVPVTPVSPGANIPLATFVIAPQATATNGSYVIGLGGLSAIGVPSTPGDCGTSADVSLNGLATFTFFQPPTITIAASPATLTDSPAQVSTVTVTSSFAPPSNLVVNLTNSMPAGRATTSCGATITILATQTTATCTVTATPNTTAFDGNVNASVTVGSGTGYNVGAPATANVAINNDDLPSVSIGASPATLFDSPGNVSTVTVTLSAPAPAGGFTVNLTPPAANARYSTTCGSTIIIAAGSTTATCTITATPNTTVGDGTVPASVAIAASGTYTISGTNPVVVTIQDDDIPVVSAVCTPNTLTDSAGQVSTCTISSDKALLAPLTVNLTPPAANARYSTTCGATIVIPTGAAGTSNTCTITAVANTTLGDGSVTASLSVAAGTGYTVGGTTQNVAVNNDDLATISVSVSPGTVAENSGTSLVFTFTASVASPSATSLLITPPPASARYSTTCVSPITLPASATTVTCSVTPVNNAVLDGSVTATVTLQPSAGNYLVGTASATGTITDDEIGVGVVATTPAVDEGGNVTFTLSCSGVGSATVNYSFSGSYSPLPAAGSALLTCGTPLQVVVPTLDDSVVNGTRTLTLTINSLTQATGSVVIDPARASATASVFDNDRPTVIPTMSPLGLMLLGLFLAAAAGLGIRRKV